MSSIYVALAFLCLKGIYGKGINSMVGPYIAYSERFYMCEPNNIPLPWRWHLRTTHFNPQRPKEIQLLTGNLTASELFDDTLQGKVVIDLRSNNQWKENAFVFTFLRNGCTNLRKNIPHFFKAVLKKSETKGPCVVKSGVYELNNTPVEWKYPNVPIIPYGQYRFRVLLQRQEKLYACLVADCRVVPKVG